MAELILHHYPMSFFAEKVRRIFAYKNLPWRSVEQPMLMPKPDLTPLTGGLRRVPVLQIGADVYVDTACIARRLERLHPQPACFPADQAPLASILEDWADRRFVPQVVPSVIIDLLPTLPPGALEDRAKMSPMLSEQMLRAAAPHTLSQALTSLDRLDAQLRNRRFLLGDAFTSPTPPASIRSGSCGRASTCSSTSPHARTWPAGSPASRASVPGASSR